MAFTPLKFLGIAAAAAVAALTQLPRRDDLSNVAEALRRIGIDAPALQSSAADNWIGGGVLLVLAALAFWLTFKPEPRQPASEPRVIAPAEPEAPPVSQNPDMPIRELFLRLAPDLADLNQSKQNAQLAGNLIRQYLASGTLLAWGKPEADSRMLYPIDPAFWQAADWTFWFLPADPRNRDLVHVALPDGSSPWRDVHVSIAGVAAVLQ
ncbi:hypothetical protein [Devosia sp.]|uniref:hypothetical protein n=1 Tax=Devosia sp. TaxID=1871048 RepID=UPI0032635A86